jgi:hypothetical protein
MTLAKVDALVEYLDSYRPSLKANIQNLTSLLSPLIEDQCLPDQRLKLEMLSESQIASRTQLLKELFEFSDDYSSFLTEAATQSLKELFEFSDDFLTETAHPDLSQSIAEGSPYPLVNLGEQADGSTAFPSPDTVDQEDPGITSFTDYLFLLSLVDPQNMD